MAKVVVNASVSVKWTADERLVRSIGGAYPFVRFIADYGLRS